MDKYMTYFIIILDVLYLYRNRSSPLREREGGGERKSREEEGRRGREREGTGREG